MNYDAVFEGGGAKGMAFVGACSELEARGHGFERLLGTSAGAITATLLSAGYSSMEMLAALSEKEGDRSVFAGFMETPPPLSDQEIADSELRHVLRGIDLRFVPDFIENRLDDKLTRLIAGADRFRHVMALLERGGWYAANRFLRWLQARLDTGQFRGAPRAFSAMTLEEFFGATGTHLSMVVSDTTDGALVVLNHLTAPRCPVVWAVRMSMSIPFVWDEVVWRAEWGTYQGQVITGHVMVDGGLLSNFPIELFISGAPEVARLMGPKSEAPILGLLIDEEKQVPPLAGKGILVRVDLDPTELKLVRRIKRLVDTATGAHDKMVIDQYANLVARLPAAGYGTTEFGMSDDRRDALVAAAQTAMANYLDKPAGLVLPSKAVGGHIVTPADRIAVGLLSRSQP